MIIKFLEIYYISIPLILLSVIAFTIIIERIFFFVLLPKVDQCNIVKELEKYIETNSTSDKNVRDEMISTLLNQKKDKFEFGISILRFIAVISPMIGLLGTVIGIIQSFKIISIHDGPIYPALIADGLWTAMLTTSAGLIIAIPTLFFAFIFMRISEKRFDKYENLLNLKSLSIEGIKIND